MFGRICIAELKKLIRSKTYMIWTFAFPLVLGTLFYFAFSTIYSSQKSETIPVVIEVTDGAINEYKTCSTREIQRFITLSFRSVTE